jgi:hypothetical protein
MAAYISPNGNGNGSINGRGIKRRDLTHYQLVNLAADAVSGVHPVVPSLSQAPKIFEGVTQSEVSEELKRRDVVRKDAEADKVLFAFADAWSERSLPWRAEALKWIAVRSDLEDVRLALVVAMQK